MTEVLEHDGEIARLRQELDKACLERVQAAEYGLEVLNQKDLLQQQYTDLESQFEVVKHELECVKQSLNQAQKSKKKISDIGINQEESLLQESADREAELLKNIGDLEIELRNCKHAAENLKSENMKLSNNLGDVRHSLELSDLQNQQMRKDLKEYKFRESRNLADYSELEDENISLQKQIAQLKQSQVFYEAMKHENKTLKEEIDEFGIEIVELEKLKKMTEKNLEEALQLLQTEREQKHSLKKELDQRIASESIFNLQMLSGLSFNAREDVEATETSDLRDHESNYDASVDGEEGETQNDMSQSIVGDLFSEIHITEVRKLEHLVEKLKDDNSKLEDSFQNSSQEVEKLLSDLSEKNERIEQLKSQLAELKQTSIFNELEGALGDHDDLETDVEVLKRRQQQQDLRYRLALEEIKDLRNQINTPDTIARLIDSLRQKESELREEVSTLRDGLSKSEVSNSNLQNDLQLITRLANEAQSINNHTQDSLSNITKNIANIYYLVCEAINETPDRLMLEHVRGKKNRTSESLDASGQERKEKGEETTNEKIEEKLNDEQGDKEDPLKCSKLLETISDQVASLGRVVERSVEMNRQKKKEEQNSSSPGADEVQELQEQVMKLKAQLSTKREQIATLRSVLKANKTTAETALASLKQKYEGEKIFVTETMQRLRAELKNLKEEAVNFQSVRGMFAQRCDEYVTQLEEQRRQLIAAEEEKKTLNSLLKMAIQQKLALTQKLEDLEFDCERKSLRQQKPMRSRLGKVSILPLNDGKRS